MRYAIIESGGKQYKAVEGQTIEVDRLSDKAGTKLDLRALPHVRRFGTGGRRRGVVPAPLALAGRR